MTPIPITFSRELPTEPGTYLFRRDAKAFVELKFVSCIGDRLHVNGVFIYNIGGEWCGPLQLIEAKEGGKESE